MKARPLFVGGTSSNAGKSWMATAICAWLRSKGVSVAPFKAQNMSNNSYPCRAGGEIGRAQVAQAEACGLEPEPAMNPVLLKPNGNGTSHVIVHGRVWKTVGAREYYGCADALRPKILEAFDDLARRFEVIVIEGAGSVTELNLRDHDLVNLGLVTRIRAPWLLVADIERGGVFGSVIGTVHLLTPEERALFRGFAINRFRGDISLFDEGVPHTRGADRLAVPRRVSACAGCAPGCGGQPGTGHTAEDTRAGRRAAGDRSTRAHLERHRLPPADVGGLADNALPESVRLRHSARQQEHNRGSGLAAVGRPGGLDTDAARARRNGRRNLRRLSDAGPVHLRPRPHGVDGWICRWPGPPSGVDRVDTGQADACRRRHDTRRRTIRRVRNTPRRLDTRPGRAHHTLRAVGGWRRRGHLVRPCPRHVPARGSRARRGLRRDLRHRRPRRDTKGRRLRAPGAVVWPVCPSPRRAGARVITR